MRKKEVGAAANIPPTQEHRNAERLFRVWEMPRSAVEDSGEVVSYGQDCLPTPSRLLRGVCLVMVEIEEVPVHIPYGELP
jgi:hypothetical protein